MTSVTVFLMTLLAAAAADVPSSPSLSAPGGVDAPPAGDLNFNYPVGDPRRCVEQAKQTGFRMQRFEVLPGIGWDNLVNTETGLVVFYNYSQCKTTDDGRFLVPDNTFTIPIKESRVKTFAEMISHWSNYTSTTARSVNVDAGLSLSKFSISGKFSYDYQDTKSKQFGNKAVTTRVQLRYSRYKIRLQPDPQLNPGFKTRLLSMAAHIELNNTAQARYEGQLLVRDFGTHVLTGVDAGAGLSKVDHIKWEYAHSQEDKKTDILASASASFFGVFHMGASYHNHASSQEIQQYEKNVTDSTIMTYGGPLYEVVNFTADDWAKGVDHELVPMDRSGDPLYFLVTAQTLPELPAATLAQLEVVVRKSVEQYYSMNTIRGCTKMGSPNFSFNANFDDGSCSAPYTNLTFGGIYQTCTVQGEFQGKDPCSDYRTVNPKTGGFTCPPEYITVELHSGKFSKSFSTRSCNSCGWWSTCCHNNLHTGVFTYTAYWCAATGPVSKDSGYLFGGVYASHTDNVITGQRSCPPYFYPRRLFSELDVCISDDYELGAPAAVPFGGFMSCDVGNPLATEGVRPVGAKAVFKAAPKNSLRAFYAGQAKQNYPMKCPDGYSQHLAFTDQGCEVNYCVLSGALSGPATPHVKRPPYNDPPSVVMPADNIVMFDNTNQVWRKNEEARQYLKSQSFSAPSISSAHSSTNDDSDDSLSPGAAAGISVGATLACVAVTTLVVMAVRRRMARGQPRMRRLDEGIFQRQDDYGSAGRDGLAAGTGEGVAVNVDNASV